MPIKTREKRFIFSKAYFPAQTHCDIYAAIFSSWMPAENEAKMLCFPHIKVLVPQF
jgi:hypothetical protein